jgi:hypothetical protein
MSCERAAELLSDHRDGLLEGPLSADLAAHLASCPACRGLDEALAEVLDLLRSEVDIAPPADLAQRAAEAALRARRRPPLRLVWAASRAGLALSARAARWGVPARVQAVAAVMAIALSAGMFFMGAAAREGAAGGGRRPALAERVSTARVYVALRRDQLLEDFRLLRVVIATAFEGRLDRVNDRVEDYRRLLERRRQEGQAKDNKKSQASLGTPGWALLRLPRVPWIGNI